MRTETILIDGWTFAEGFSDDRIGAPMSGTSVELPHTAVELPFDYFDETSYQKPFTYQRRIPWKPEFAGQHVSLLFEGAMADTTVWLNGTEIIRHRDGYTPFEADLTGHLTEGENLLTVRIDGSENPEIPPFGGQIDYLTYAGIYRDVHLRVTPTRRIENVKVETPDPLAEAKSVRAAVFLSGAGEGRLTARLLTASGEEIATTTADASGDKVELALDDLAGLSLWTPEAPTLYTLEVTLASDAGEDRVAPRFGFREARFTTAGFELNGKPLKLMGLNRHQSFPYSGYAQGRKSQARDAEILKWDLGCNIARTSHYPQSRHFLDRCDEIGLLVLEEIPGWQHIGGEGWKAESVENVRRMIERDWNRPSIILWGVRINESEDDHDFYAETNRLARELDPTRQTGGIRFKTESELLEDVYTMNDFVLGHHELPGNNRGRTALRPQSEVTGLDHQVPYLITEYNGHMFPTKSGDQEQRVAEHALRHAEVVDAAFGAEGTAGCIGWCYSDYNTHRDFGSGDRICHHGVTTMFREPKFAGQVYASQQPPQTRIVMEPVTYYARGERNIGGILPLVVLTNCDEIELRYGTEITARAQPDRDRFPHMPHPPVIFDDRHFPGAAMGLWGMSWEDGEIIGYLDGKEVVRKPFSGGALPDRLEVAPDAETLEAAMRDEVRVMVRALDQSGNVLPFLSDGVTITVDGPARLIGPETAQLRGGTTGFWLRATGGTGAITVTLSSTRFEPVTVTLAAV